MTSPMVDKIVHALLYEGYILYPYRPSVKNHQRWTFGGLYPPPSNGEALREDEPQQMQTECLVAGSQPAVQISVRFLHLMDRMVGKLDRAVQQLPADGMPAFERVASQEVGGRLFQSWQEAVERNVAVADAALDDLVREPRVELFEFPASKTVEPLSESSGEISAVLVREQQPVAGMITLSAEKVAPELFRLRVAVANRSPLSETTAETRHRRLLQTLVSTHTILSVRHGAFLSLLDPPAAARQAAAACANVGTWPVLVGEAGETDTLLSSPIILYDYPHVAPESPGDLFDGTEIDEILTLRIMTLTDDEKRLMQAVDERARAVLQRTESLTAAELLQLHGTVRGLRAVGEERHD